MSLLVLGYSSHVPDDVQDTRQPSSPAASWSEPSTCAAYDAVAPASPQAGVSTSWSDTSPGRARACRAAASTRSMTAVVDGGRGRRSTAPRPRKTWPPLVEDGREVVVAAGREHAEVDRDARRAGAAEQRDRHVGGAAVRDGGRAAEPRRSTHSSGLRRRRRVAPTRCRPKPEAVGTCAGQHDRQRRLVDLEHERRRPGTRRCTSARWSRTPSASAWASSRRAPWSLSTLSPRGFSTVEASVHGPATWTLSGPA